MERESQVRLVTMSSPSGSEESLFLGPKEKKSSTVRAETCGLKVKIRQ